MAGERAQKNGKQKAWKLEELKSGLELFYGQNERYPTSQEIDAFAFLPSSRSIQRRFGGLVELRKTLGLSGQDDFTKGEHSSRRATEINKRAHMVEKEVHTYLTDLFSTPFVHREYFFLDDKRTRTDFFVYHQNGEFSVDVFYPKDRYNLIGCLNSKLRKYDNELLTQYPVIFLQMNKDISSEELRGVLKNKKNKLKKYQHLMCLEEFKQFCASKEPKTSS